MIETATESISEFEKGIEANCMRQWAKVVSKAPAMALIWQSQVREVTPWVSGTLRRGHSVEVKLLSSTGLEFHFKTSVPYFWCVNNGAPCSRGHVRTPTHFFELGTQKAIPMMVALAKGSGMAGGASSAIGDWFGRMDYM